MQPQPLARRFLPADTYQTLHQWAHRGVPADCGPDWADDVIEAARTKGPHVSALTPENVDLVWEDITYQQSAGFIRIVPESELFGTERPNNLKVSRVAVVPQVDRRGRIILNLSAEVDLNAGNDHTKRRRRRSTRGRKPPPPHPSVNETTVLAEDQSAVKALGTAVPAILRFAFDVDPSWEIDWQKIDLSDGFWRMIVEAGQEHNFVYQLPRRPGDTETYYVVPSSLQMGWQNSPAYFCSATEATRCLAKRLLALSLLTGLEAPHRHKNHCLEPRLHTIDAPLPPPRDLALLSKVYVDDFMNAIAGPVGRGSKRKRQEQLWVARCALHAIHAIFPPPDVLGHTGGRDSVSEKKLKRGDACFKPYEILLGLGMHGGPGASRTVAIPSAKKDKYLADLREVLAKKYVSRKAFETLRGRLVHLAEMMPCMRGLMGPINQVLRRAGQTIGLGKHSELREVLETFAALLELGHEHPSHITELVPPDLPHFYGYFDAASYGNGGVMLPCTTWTQPLVWRLIFPPEIIAKIQNQEIPISFAEAVTGFISECMVDDLANESDVLAGSSAGVSIFLGTDNTNAEGWKTRGSSRSEAQFPNRMLRFLALRQRFTRRGPSDWQHFPGKTNLMADFASRSSTEEFGSYGADQDDEFLADFANRFPLPAQLGSWRLVRPRPEIVSEAISMLLNRTDMTIHPATVTGEPGVGLPVTLATTLSSLDCNTQRRTTWNEASCSWPLLTPCGKVITTAESPLPERRSRQRFVASHSTWTIEELKTLADDIGPSTS